ncbi:MAG: ATP-grasp domain-containing protein [Proteobacteria bacterium]|nr:ATP-grasp domain-containing protein [Pseudomonadota bacterium]
MFLIDKPYISDFFKATIRDNNIPVIGTAEASEFDLYPDTRVISEATAITAISDRQYPCLYSNSENSIGWIAKQLAFSQLPGQIDLFKNKLKFRELTQSLFPEFYYQGITTQDLVKIKPDNVPLPFIIKPAVGFFSLGVHKVSALDEWDSTVDSILQEIQQIKEVFPAEVLDTSNYIIEQCIEGDEYAIDAYVDESGDTVILGIFKHVFSSAEDVSDRVYITSKEIIEENLDEFTGFLNTLSQFAGIRNFPLHVELRRDSNGLLLPIEVNPLRFGGMCTTADATYMAYGFNPYLYYYQQNKPDWDHLLEGKENKLFSIIVLDNSTGIPAGEIRSFDYEKLLTRFERPLELRKFDHSQYPLFGFLFTETRADNFEELKSILHSDLSEYISLQS